MPDVRHQQVNNIYLLFKRGVFVAELSNRCGIAGGTNCCRDTGNDLDIFAANVKAKGIDLRQFRFRRPYHRHSDHMAGLSHVSLPNDERPPP